MEDKARPSLMQEGSRLRVCLWQPGFHACRGKAARVINYEEFKKALEELAPKRFKDKSKEEAYEAICQLVAGKEPINVGVTVSERSPGCRRAGWEWGTELCLRWSRNTFWGTLGHRGHGRVLSGCQELVWGEG